MKSIVLDTNCLLALLPKRSPYHCIWTELLEGRLCLCVTNEILMEYEEILLLKIGNLALVDAVIKTLENIPHFKCAVPYFRFNLIQQDPDDNKFVDCAICSGATYLVSNDKHFDVLKRIDFPKIDLKSIQEFVAEINSDI